MKKQDTGREVVRISEGLLRLGGLDMVVVA